MTLDNAKNEKKSNKRRRTGIVLLIIYVIILIFIFLALMDIGTHLLVAILVIVFLFLLFLGATSAIRRKLYKRLVPESQSKPDYQKEKDKFKIKDDDLYEEPEISENINIDFEYKKPLIQKCPSCGFTVASFMKTCPNCGHKLID
jgi:predicted membrane protein